MKANEMLIIYIGEGGKRNFACSDAVTVHTHSHITIDVRYADMITEAAVFITYPVDTLKPNSTNASSTFESSQSNTRFLSLYESIP